MTVNDTTPAPARVYNATKTTVTIDHTDHAHPTTKSARAACRRAMSRHDYSRIDVDTITTLTRSLDDDIAANATRVLDSLSAYNDDDAQLTIDDVESDETSDDDN